MGVAEGTWDAQRRCLDERACQKTYRSKRTVWVAELVSSDFVQRKAAPILQAFEQPLQAEGAWRIHRDEIEQHDMMRRRDQLSQSRNGGRTDVISHGARHESEIRGQVGLSSIQVVTLALVSYYMTFPGDSCQAVSGQRFAAYPGSVVR